MTMQIIFIYCLCDDILKSMNVKDDPQCKMNSAEIMTFVIVSALHYQCNYEKTRFVLKSQKYFLKMLSQSRLVRRIHKIPLKVWIIAFHVCKNVHPSKHLSEYIVDSFPVPVCQMHKSFRCKLLRGKRYHGYIASKKSYFFGVKVHMIVTLSGLPVEFIMTPGSEADIRAFKRFNFAIPTYSRIYADRAYNNYSFEDLLEEIEQIKLIPKRKMNAKRRNIPTDDYLLSIHRNKVETVFSTIVSMMPRTIRAVSVKGFFMKIFFFILGYTVKKIIA